MIETSIHSERTFSTGSLLRVFLSSRFDEHRLLRRSLARLLNQYGFVAVDLDDGQADERSIEHRSLEELAGSDIVIVVIGRSYASNSGGDVSVTHREFREALVKSKLLLAYHSPTIDAGSPAAGFLAEAQAAVTVAPLSLDDEADARRVLNDLFRRIVAGTSSSDDRLAQPEHGFHRYQQPDVDLEREAAYLGFASAYAGAALAQPTAGGYAQTQAGEQCQFAFEALRLSRPDIALPHLEKALELHPLNWLAGYSLAWLVARTESRRDLMLACRAAQNALSTAQASVRAPGTDPLPADLLMRRRVAASRLLVARLAITAGDRKYAREQLESALRDEPLARAALVERLRLAGLDSSADEAFAPARVLLQCFPDQLIQAVGTTELQGIRRALEVRLIEHMAAASPSLRQLAGAPDAGVQDIVVLLRQDYEAHRRRAATVVRQLRARCIALAQSLAALTGQAGEELATVESAKEAEAALVRDQALFEKKCIELANERASLTDCGWHLIQVENETAQCQRRIAALDDVLRKTGRRIELLGRSLPFFDRFPASFGLGAIALVVVAGFGAASVGLIATGWAVALLVAGLLASRRSKVIGTRLAGMGRAAVLHWKTSKEQKQRRHAADRHERTAELARLGAKKQWWQTEAARQAQVVTAYNKVNDDLRASATRLAAVRQLIEADAASPEGPLERARMQDALARLVYEKDVVYAPWAFVVRSNHQVRFLPECGLGHLTIVRGWDGRIGASPGDPDGTSRLLRCVARQTDGSLWLSHFSVWADSAPESSAFLALETLLFGGPQLLQPIRRPSEAPPPTAEPSRPAPAGDATIDATY